MVIVFITDSKEERATCDDCRAHAQGLARQLGNFFIPFFLPLNINTPIEYKYSTKTT